MATRTPLYKDFAAGEVKEIAFSDTIAFNPSGITGDFTGQAGKYLRVAAAADVLEFATVAGGGDVVGPASSVDNRVVFFNGTTGKLIKDSGLLLSGTNTGDSATPAETATTIGSLINGATGKTTPVDADNVSITDSAASHILKKLTWANLKATLKTYFDTLYNLYVHPNHSGDVTSVGDGAQTIAADAVTNAKLANMAANSIKGNNTGGVADPLDLTATQVTAMLNAFTSLLQGLVPASGGGTTTYLRADGTFAAPTSSLPESVYTSNIITSDTTVPANYSLVVRGRLKVNSGIRLKPAVNASIIVI